MLSLLILYVALAIGVSFICSLLEAVLLSLTPAYVRVYRQAHPRRGCALAALHENLDRPLSAILSLNTVAHTVGATGAGAEAAQVFGNAWVGLFAAALTLAILVLSEIIPKTLGAVHWRRLTPLAAIVLPMLVSALKPLVWLAGWLTSLIRQSDPVAVSRAEIAAMADIGAAQGTLATHETVLLKNLLRFRDVTVEDVMTPLSVVGAHPASLPVADAVAEDLPFSRIPVHDGSIEQIDGYVMRDDLLAQRDTGGPVGDLKRAVLELTSTSSLPNALDAFIGRREKIAVIDGPGGDPIGILTLEDVLEALLGREIVDEADVVVDMRALARSKGQGESGAGPDQPA